MKSEQEHAVRYTTLISAADLAQHLSDPKWIILDCRHDLGNPQAGQDAFAAGRIPGAQFAHLDRDLSDKRPGPQGEFRGRHPLPTREAFIETLRNWGINPDSQVIAYDAQGGMFAARLWWMLRWVGHEQVAVLDGGLPAWVALGQALSSELERKPRGTIALQAAVTATVDANDVLTNLAQPARTVIDARAPDRFRGENETLDPVGGHIPSAKNRFFKDNLLPDGRFKPAEQLRSEFAGLIGEPQSAIMQCGSGVTACHNLLALEIAGLSGAALYPGSWSEWCSDASRPIAKGVE
jgi:thiosulfate/3-mercaptopyruvate sulfurtransferase